ncbi:MAG TPA: hypothetical protein VGM30_23955 [Puia sp.]|jgi:hypothetical protein
MDKPLKIVFDFNLDGSARVIQLEAVVVLHHSAPHYRVSRISRQGHINYTELLPEVDLKCVLADGGHKWVHTDSGKETYLSNVIGKAIEKLPGAPKIARESEDPDEDV